MYIFIYQNRKKNNEIEKMIFIDEINKILLKKKIRNENFPSEISENIVKFFLLKKYKISACWDTESGDVDFMKHKIEVKGFMSTGPTSFGPKEQWDWIYFVDARDTLHKIYKIYEIKLSNSNSVFLNMKMNKNETFEEQCKQKRRPRISFFEIKIFDLFYLQ
jgi:ABC-type antimicrobial peptide transport system permease subunit